MVLKQAVEILKNYKEDRLPLFIDVRVVYEAIDTVLAELDKQKQVNAEMRKVAFEEGFEEGFEQGRIKGIMEVVKEDK